MIYKEHFILHEEYAKLQARLQQAEALLRRAWAAFGDNMMSQSLGGKGISEEYAQAVCREINAFLWGEETKPKDVVDWQDWQEEQEHDD